jgi:hypothetical protein
MLTPIRRTYRSALTLDLDAQLQECVEQLQHPELIASELLTSYAEIARSLQTTEHEPLAKSGGAEPDRTRAFYPGRDIFVVRDSSSFTCLAVDVEPLPPDEPDGRDEPQGLDYLAITCTGTPQAVLGVLQPSAQQSAYPLLLRLLACLCEVAHEEQMSRLDRDCFRGLLGPDSSLDLHLVLWDDWIDEETGSERTPISQLTHDLAEVAKRCLDESPAFPPILRNIVCLSINPKRFDGRVRFDWRV